MSKATAVGGEAPASSPTDDDCAAGARNLLCNCVRARAGERLLLVGESGSDAWFEPQLCQLVADEALRLGLQVEVVWADPVASAADFPAHVAERMRHVEHTVFFSRLGDQVRFCASPGEGSKTMCYTYDAAHLAAGFGRLPHGLCEAVHDRLVDAIGGARSYRIRCPAGSDLTGSIDAGRATFEQAPRLPGMAEFTLKLFPVTIFPPILAHSLSGRLVLAHWLTSTSTIAYEDSVLGLDEPVVAIVEQGRITTFEGSSVATARVEAHFERVAAIVGGDPWVVNSWHAGIHPQTFSERRPGAEHERWDSEVFGSPRFTHFHCCGTEPGHVAVPLFDASISFDEEPFWTDGRFSFLERPDILELTRREPGGSTLLEQRWDIGI